MCRCALIFFVPNKFINRLSTMRRHPPHRTNTICRRRVDVSSQRDKHKTTVNIYKIRSSYLFYILANHNCWMMSSVEIYISLCIFNKVTLKVLNPHKRFCPIFERNQVFNPQNEQAYYSKKFNHTSR